MFGFFFFFLLCIVTPFNYVKKKGSVALLAMSCAHTQQVVQRRTVLVLKSAEKVSPKLFQVRRNEHNFDNFAGTSPIMMPSYFSPIIVSDLLG